MAPFYGWGSTASRLEPLRGGSLPITTKKNRVKLRFVRTEKEQSKIEIYNNKEHSKTEINNDLKDEIKRL